MVSVHIIADKKSALFAAWAEKLARALDYVTWGHEPDFTAPIQYYIPYALYQSRVSERELALFMQPGSSMKPIERFTQAAADMDCCVCLSEACAAELYGLGAAQVEILPPPMDEEALDPCLTVGVPGSAFDDEGEGAALVAEVWGMPGVIWRFQGEGWPAPPDPTAHCSHRAFYQSVDCILIPSGSEQAACYAREALACGKIVIAPKLRWHAYASELHIYEQDSVIELKQVLSQLAARQAKPPSSSIDAWIAAHDALFQRIGSALPEDAREKRLSGPVGLWMEKQREGASRGGPSLRVPRTVAELRALGVRAGSIERRQLKFHRFSLVHGFNIWPPEAAGAFVEEARASGASIVFSPILLDLSESPLFEEEIPNLFKHAATSVEIDAGFAALRQRRAKEIEVGYALREGRSGLFGRIRRVLDAVDHVICLSEEERSLLHAMGVEPRAVSLVHNATDVEFYASGDPELFAQAYALREYVLCVGRIEPRKNQLTLLHALRGVDIPIVLLGHSETPDYLELVRRHAGPNVHIIDRLSAGSEMLASAYAGARVFVLPSWCEGASLSTLEAAAAGCALVLSDRSAEQEYFGEFARYCSPADPDALRAAVLDAWEHPLTPEARARQQAFIHEQYNWERHTRAITRVYEATLAAEKRPHRTLVCGSTLPHIYVDLTSSARRLGPPTGISRLETMCALHLQRVMPERITFVAWHWGLEAFSPITPGQLLDGSYKMLVHEGTGWDGDASQSEENHTPKRIERAGVPPFGLVDFEPGSLFLVMGGMWMNRKDYLDGLLATKRVRRLRLIGCVCDVIRAQFPYLYPEDISSHFTHMASRFLRMLDKAVAISACGARDLEAFCERRLIPLADLSVIRLGDEIGEITEPGGDVLAELQALLNGEPFVLCVSALDVRKNHTLLHRLWLRLIEQFGERTPHLVLVGAPSHHVDDLLAIMQHDEHLMRRVHISHEVRDGALDWLYRNCLFTVYPSLYEGWGIPVAESLAYGKVCLASNAASIPEIAPSLTDLLDPYDFAAWYAAILHYAFNAAGRRHRESAIARDYVRTSWADTARRVAALLAEPIAMRTVCPGYEFGTVLGFGSEREPGMQPAEPYKAGGWWRAERKAAWTVGHSAYVTMELPKVEGPLLLFLYAAPYRNAASAPISAQAVINGEPVAHWTIAEPRRIAALIPAEAARRTGLMRSCIIELRIENPCRPSSESDSEDTRPLGLFVESLELRAVAPCALDEAISFGVDGGAGKYQFSGWGKPQDSATWTKEAEASLALRLESPPAGVMELCIEAKAYVNERKPSQTVEIIANGHLLERGVWETPGIERRRLHVPHEILDNQDALLLTFRFEQLQSPRELGLGADDRKLGLLVKSLMLRPEAP